MNRCVLCAGNNGNRVCRLHNNEIICSICCVKQRNEDCKDCRHYIEAKKYAESKGVMTEKKKFIAEINPEVEEAVAQALALVEKGNIKKGKSILDKLDKIHHGNHSVLYGLGVVHAFKKQHDEAIEYFSRAIDIFPYFVEAHFNKAVAYKEKMDMANMIRSFKEVVAVGDPDNDMIKEAKKFLDKTEQHLKKTDGVDLETFLEAEEIFQESFSCMENREWGRALEKLKECMNKNKANVQTYGNMGICYAQLGRKEEALAAFDKALEIDINYEPAIVNKTAVQSLKEGETLGKFAYSSVDYYKDYAFKKKSLIKSILHKLFK